jgi:hypothetical protein
MKTFLPISLAVALLLKPTQQAAKAQSMSLSNTYNDCAAYQRLTACTNCVNDDDTTYPYSADGATPTTDYETVTCNFAGICPDNVQRTTCTWRRYMYLECLDNSPDPASYALATNSLPNHCYDGSTSAPVGSTTAY